jgi:hypothetical protein
LYWKFGRRFHDPHERPFSASDIVWIARKFECFEYYVCNYVSLPLGIISSVFSQTPDNAVMRAADRADRLLARKWPFLKPRFRSAIFVIEKKH